MALILVLARLSPACAGNGRGRLGYRRAAPAQPRVRGERYRAWVGGSAPRARGTVPRTPSSRSSGRLSPACAGNGRSSAPPAEERSAQPRVRGERQFLQQREEIVGGSPPRARGTERADRDDQTIDRLTPACAGNGHGCDAFVLAGTAHPRVRGERTTTPTRNASGAGSAPRARGTARCPSPTNSRWRLSPACAGNGLDGPSISTPAAAQPRVRGERAVSMMVSDWPRGSAPRPIPASSFIDGSAPRARGTGRTPDHRVFDARLSPACAGERDTDR